MERKTIKPMKQTGYEFLLPNGKCGHIMVLDGDKILKARRTTKERAGGNGFGISTNNVSFTLNTIDRHGVAVIR